ncbi:hypothetical protein Y032_0205g1930 [Ancylostoma ceylanicum]|uniref:Transcription factor 25 n=1 Tax=Ancylostoma ceylanicum TaxID=53326 RepID=A0A016SME2_9BILA|nr:hypothetical protein Y032_0205g1930 [Ancylostoma ceylanicum]
MSTKHLRRLIEEKEHEECTEDLEEDVPSQKAGPVNRFAAFVDDEEVAEKSGTSDEENKDTRQGSENHVESKVLPTREKNEKKANKKKKKKQKKKETEELDDDQLLEQLASENQMGALRMDDEEPLGVAQVLKPDPRSYDAAAELKRALGKAFKDSAPIVNRSHRNFHGGGKIVKQKHNWPPVRNIGLSMELDREEGEVKWFKFVHNSHYEKLERLCWVSEDSFDPSLIEEILVDNPYHLNSLLLLANVFRMQEDITQSCDVIERGIFYCEQSMASTFQPSSFYHRVDYLDYENRAFYLLLHRQMLNCVHKRCFETALNFAKLILTMDPQRDPLAVFLLIDTIAIKAKQYKWLKNLYRCCKEWKNLDMLPNFCYSMALAQFLDSKTDEDFIVADEMLSHAICAFPGVVTFLLDKMQVEPDAAVESHRHLGTFAANKETDGLKLVFKMYANEAVELWKAPEALSWLEAVTRECTESKECEIEMEKWKEKRQRVFVGVPPNVRRLAVLLGLESSSSSVTNPVPPVNGRARYTREPTNVQGPDGFLSGFLHSILPEFDSGEHLADALQRLRNQLQQAIFPPAANPSEQQQPPPPQDGAAPP